MNTLDKIPNYLIYAYLTHISDVIYGWEQNGPDPVEPFEPYGCNQNVPYLTQAEQDFRFVHSLILQEIHSRGILPEDFFNSLIGRCNLIHEKRGAKEHTTVEDIVSLVNNKARLELMSDIGINGQSRLYNVLTLLGSSLESFHEMKKVK